MRKEESSRFRIKQKDVIWSVKLFTLFAILAFAFSISVYLVAFHFSQPEATSSAVISTTQAANSEIDVVNDAIVSTSEAATSKVDIGARYIGPLYSVFVFNTIAVLVTSLGTGAITYSHRLVFREMIFRSRHPFYSRIVSGLNKPSPTFLSLIQKTAARIYPELRQYQTTENIENSHSIWKKYGYTGEEYRAVASILPLIFPVMTLFLNGLMAGIFLALFLFNGMLLGGQTAGFAGILAGADLAFVYYLASLLPHGIIELPVIFIATSLAYRFARVHSEEIIKGQLFDAENDDDIEKDIRRIENLTRDYLRSGYTWKIFSIMIFMLLVAAYIEIQLTPKISGHVSTWWTW
jgi:uncharacterized membrane protein SpoIIM required for sporulation